MQSLQGEFACVPFGTGDPARLPEAWRAAGDVAVQHGPPHGHGANAAWRIGGDAGRIVAEIDYPPDHSVARLTREIRPDGPGRIAFELAIHPRRDAVLPVALHPVFRLSAAPGASHLRLGAHGPVYTHPCGASDAPCPLVPDSVAHSLAALPGRDGQARDYSRLPLAEAAESRLLVTNAGGQVSLVHRHEGWSVTLEWDAALLPSLMLWVSNRGRTAAPWNGRNLGLGLEPCASAFDLGEAASRAANPLSASGVATGLVLRAEQPCTIRSAIFVSLLS